MSNDLEKLQYLHDFKLSLIEIGHATRSVRIVASDELDQSTVELLFHGVGECEFDGVNSFGWIDAIREIPIETITEQANLFPSRRSLAIEYYSRRASKEQVKLRAWIVLTHVELRGLVLAETCEIRNTVGAES